MPTKLEEETSIRPNQVIEYRVLDSAPSNNLEFDSVSVFVVARICSTETEKVKVCEPEKCYEWKWVDPENVQVSPLFYPLTYLLTEKRNLFLENLHKMI